MKTLLYKLIVLALLATSVGFAQTVTLNVESDRGVFLAGQKQTAFVRIGLTGCPIETVVPLKRSASVHPSMSRSSLTNPAR
ncbi:MAG: hypothetical protein ACYS8S_05210 [Planctomycetota bacterium]|jgi:hypothetical protein